MLFSIAKSVLLFPLRGFRFIRQHRFNSITLYSCKFCISYVLIASLSFSTAMVLRDSFFDTGDSLRSNPYWPLTASIQEALYWEYHCTYLGEPPIPCMMTDYDYGGTNLWQTRILIGPIGITTGLISLFLLLFVRKLRFSPVLLALSLYILIPASSYVVNRYFRLAEVCEANCEGAVPTPRLLEKGDLS